MKNARILGLALCALALALSMFGNEAWAQGVPVIGPLTFAFTGSGQSNVWTCNGGQSSFSLTIPSGLVGTFTVTVAQQSSVTYVNPPWSYAPGVATFANTVTNSGSLTVNLGSNAYVKVADTSYSSGSVTVTGVCSSAVAVIPPQPTPTPAPTPSPVASGVLTITGSYPYTFYAPPSPSPVPSPTCATVTCSFVGFTLTVQASPTPAPTPSPVASSNITISGSYPYTISATTPTPAPTMYPTPFTNLVCSNNIVCSPSAGPSPSISETNAPTWSGTASSSAANPFAMSGVGTNTITSNTTGANNPFVFNANNTTAPTGLLAQFQIGGTEKFKISSSGATTAAGSSTATEFFGSGAGLSSATIPSSALVAPPVYPLVTLAGYSAVPLTGGSTYTTLATPSITLGTSTGPTGAWDVRVLFAVNISAPSELMAACIEGANAGTSGVGDLDAIDGSTCITSPANALAGARFDTAASLAYLHQGPILYEAQYANGASLSFTCQFYNATVSLTASGYCNIQALPI